MRSHDVAVAPEGVIKEMLDVWREQAGPNGIPTAPLIDAAAIARLTPHIMVIAVEPGEDKARFRARLVGAAHRRLVKVCHAGDLVDSFDADHADHVREAAETGQPVLWQAVGNTVADFPFAADGRTVDRVVSIYAPALN